MAGFQDKNEVPQAAMVSGAGDVITSSTLFRWTAQGKVFEAGFGLEDTAIDSAAAVDDQAATFSLQAPASSSLLVIPILLKLMLISDGGALTNYQVAFTKPAALIAASGGLTLSGTALTSKHCLYRTSPALSEQHATALSGVTVAVLTAPDFITYHFGHVIDAVITSGLLSLGEGPSNVHTFRFLQEGIPHVLTQGAAMLVYTYTGSGDSTWLTYMQWAEVTKDDLY